MVTKYQNYINGKWVHPASDRHFEVINPFNQEVIAECAKSSKEDTKEAIEAARTSFDKGTWSEKLAGERASIIWKLADLVEKNKERLATLESKNQGKTIKYARDSDLPTIIDNLRFFAGVCRNLEGKSASEYSGMGTSMIKREPIGVVSAVVPWNYPLYIAVWKLAPALAAGNSVVIKPASYTPLTLLEFAKLAGEAGIPKGVLNVITGEGHVVGAEMATNSKVDMITFTGDTETGKKVLEMSSHTVKKVVLELGGKAPMVVLPDADLGMVSEGSVVGACLNAGQDCTAVTRVYVQEKQHNQLVKMMVNVAKRFKLGNQLDEKTDMGPLMSEKQRERVESYVKLGLDQGAKLECGGSRPKGKLYEKGFFIEPAIFSNVSQNMKICQEEIFGPVISVIKYKTVDEAIKKANDVKYGLASSVYGTNVSDCMQVAKKLDFGTVWINEHGVLASEMPHGGFKQSGFGKELSMYGLDEYTRIKHVYIDLTKLNRRPWHYTVYGKP